MKINKIGYNIMNAMAEQKLSISELARRMHFCRTSVSKYINYPGKMQVDVFCRIAQELGKSMNELMEGVLDECGEGSD